MVKAGWTTAAGQRRPVGAALRPTQPAHTHPHRGAERPGDGRELQLVGKATRAPRGRRSDGDQVEHNHPTAKAGWMALHPKPRALTGPQRGADRLEGHLTATTINQPVHLAHPFTNPWPPAAAARTRPRRGTDHRGDGGGLRLGSRATRTPPGGQSDGEPFEHNRPTPRTGRAVETGREEFCLTQPARTGPHRGTGRPSDGGGHRLDGRGHPSRGEGRLNDGRRAAEAGWGRRSARHRQPTLTHITAQTAQAMAEAGRRAGRLDGSREVGGRGRAGGGGGRLGPGRGRSVKRLVGAGVCSG